MIKIIGSIFVPKEQAFLSQNRDSERWEFVIISRLRSKIDKGFAKPLLHTVRGSGYMIRDGAD